MPLAKELLSFVIPFYDTASSNETGESAGKKLSIKKCS
jgi:hypothetical protein